MSHFKGKRHSPYGSKSWKDHRRDGNSGSNRSSLDGGNNRGGGGGSSGNASSSSDGNRGEGGNRTGNDRQTPKDEVTRSVHNADINNVDPHGGSDERHDTPREPITINEKGRREKKFGNRARLYVGNLPRGMMEDELRQLFSQFGETDQVFVDKEKNFGFVRMGYRSEGERAIAALNGEEVKGRELRVRFAASSCSVKVHNLHHTVSNELLMQAFSNFGEVEYAAVMTDERGKSLGYGVVDFAKKSQAMNAIEKCRNGCFILTRSPIPVYVTELNRENEEGLPEKQLQHTNDYNFERDSFPRMALPGSPEYDFAMRWKNLYDAEKKVRDEVDAQLKEQRRLLEADTDQFHHHEHAALIRQQLLEHQREQMRLEERLRQHEEFIKGHGSLSSFGMSGSGVLPPILSSLQSMVGLGQLNMPGPPQPLLTERLGERLGDQPFIKSENLESDRDGGSSSYASNMQYLLQQNSQFTK